MPAGGSAVEFTDPSFKGSLIAYDRPRIPEDYRGLWADRQASCARPDRSGSNISIGTFAIDQKRVVRVETYSDHPAIVVSMRGTPDAWLDIALDGNHISLRRGNGTGTKILMRCPDTPDSLTAKDAYSDAWLSEAKLACKTDDFDIFGDTFLRSVSVRRQYVGKQVTLNGPFETRNVSRRFYTRSSLPLRDFSVFATARSREMAGVSVSSSRLQNDLYRIGWLSHYEVVTIGPDGEQQQRLRRLAGWLDFSRSKGCWRLIEDAVAIEHNE
jgi:hypothetical protein